VANKQTSTTDFNLWGILLPFDILSPSDIDYLDSIAGMERPSVDWIWQEMDRIWDVQGLDNRLTLQKQAISEFYSHPIWVVNGVFTATDPVSIQHRDAIALFVRRLGVERIADYGGGFGELAKKLSAVDSKIQIDIVEPYPSKLGMQRIKHETNIRFIKEFENQYDCVIAQDVLEHVEHPLELVEKLVSSTQFGGYLIFANCFYPVIKCHLPSTFYLRHTFRWVMQGAGLEYVGQVDGVSHAQVFRRVRNIKKTRLKFLKSIAQFVGPFVNRAREHLGRIKARWVIK
jgi:2-polyprenyl-6-hydroxyphenyl methylase/3-demethylubiquinone-9 3-methyltransferase